MTQTKLNLEHPDDRRPGELTFFETARWAWRQLTSMRTALVLLLLLALASVPGSVIPQRGVDSLKTSRWQAQHPSLTPIYERLQLFSVYDSIWFSAIYILLMISLVGCILPRLGVYWRAMRSQPPAAPRHLDRLPHHETLTSTQAPAQVLAHAAEVLRRRGYRVVTPADPSAPATSDPRGGESVSAERGYLREAGNLLFHVSLLLVLVGFALGGLFGYKGGVILVVGNGFSNNLTQYDDFLPGSLFDPNWMDPFSFSSDSFAVEWIESGPGQGMARKFALSLTYRETPGAPRKTYDLKVNQPLAIGDTEIFLIGHGYAPVITIRDGKGDVAYRGPTVFLPESANFRSFGVVKAPDARPTQIGLEGFFYPTYLKVDGDPINVMGDLRNPTLSLLAYSGDLGMDDGAPQSVYLLDKSRAEPIVSDDGKPFRVDLQVGQGVVLPNRLGSVTFDGVERWNKLQISRTPGTGLALTGAVLALVGLIGSLYVRPRRIWVRARTIETDRSPMRRTSVEVAGLDRSGNGDVPAELAEIVDELAAGDGESTTKENP